MAIPIVPNPTVDRNLEARRKLARLAVYRNAGRQGQTPTRAFLVAVVAWRLGDIPAEFPPSPADFGLTDAQGAAWSATVDSWVEEVTRDV